jgi:hypothetical protein
MGQPPSQETPTNPDPEVLAAIEALSLKDIERLKSYAWWKMRGLAGRVRAHEWKDLLQQAYFKTLYGDRPWTPEDRDKLGRPISMVQHLFGCMRSIADGWSERESRYTSLPEEHEATDNIEARVEAHTFEAHTCLEQLAQGLKGDFDALLVLEAIERGYLPNETQADFHIAPERYWAAKRRITRRGKRLFEPPQDSPI